MGTITRSFANNITSGGTFDATDLTGTIPASNIADTSVGNVTEVTNLSAVSTVASDPPSPADGQVWYNTSDRILRGYVLQGTWSTQANMNTGRRALGGAGNNTAALAFAGDGVPATDGALTESYNGTAWTEVNDLNNGKRQLAGTGTQTSALAIGGIFPYSGETESWNGTSWTELNDLNTVRNWAGSAGADNTDAIAFGGLVPGDVPTVNAETWNGTSWTEVNNLNTGRASINGIGSSTAALSTCGSGAETESWNGTSWTSVNDMNVARTGYSSSGSITSALVSGSGTPAGATESWNGTSWSNENYLSVGRTHTAGSRNGTNNTAALTFGGTIPTSSPTQQSATEEWLITEVVKDLGVS